MIKWAIDCFPTVFWFVDDTKRQPNQALNEAETVHWQIKAGAANTFGSRLDSQDTVLRLDSVDEKLLYNFRHTHNQSPTIEFKHVDH